MVQHKITGRYPRVIDQVPVLELERAKLFKYGYNPSIIEEQGKILMAYRYHDGKTLHSDLALAMLDYDGKVIHNRKIDLGPGGEDPKLFTFGGQTYLSWVESTFPNQPWRSVVSYGLLEKGPIPHTPELPGNDFSTIQKNWVFFGSGTALYCIYQCHPEQVTYCLQGAGMVSKFTVTPGPRWPYGHIRGGTSPVLFEGNLLRFFHSGLDNEFQPPHRRYFLGAYLMRPDPPFEVIAVSGKPIVYGSEIDDGKVRDRPIHWKGNVIFPGGAVANGDHFLVSCGVNDFQCQILKIYPKDFHLC